MLAEPRRASFVPAAAKLVVCALLLISPAALAQSSPGGSSLEYSGVLYGQINPRAVAMELRVDYRHALSPTGDGLFGGSSIGAFAALGASPAGIRPTVGVEIQPLAIFSLGVDYTASYYFGSGLAQSYPSPRSDYSSGAFSAPVDGPGGRYSLLVQQLTLHATLQATLGPLAVRSTTRAARFFADLHGSDRVFYDPAFDVAVYKDGWVGQNDTDLLYIEIPTLAFGLRHTLTIAWYPDGAYSPGEPQDNPNTPISKLGPVALINLFQSDTGPIRRGTLLLVAQWYLAHRYRAGETVSGALPLLGIGFAFSSDLQRIR